MINKLSLQEESSGLRHYLNGRPVNCGTQLLLAIHPENHREELWTWARYEANLSRNRVSVTLHTVFGIVVPDETTRLKWPGDNGAAPRRFERVGLNVRTPELPAAVMEKLAKFRGKYTDPVTVYHLVPLCAEGSWIGVFGDGANGAYEWFICTPDHFQTSDAGWGSTEAALKEVINKTIS